MTNFLSGVIIFIMNTSLRKEIYEHILMSSLVKPRKRSFLPRICVRDKLQQESGKTQEKTGFPLKDCGNDNNINNVLLLMVSLVEDAPDKCEDGANVLEVIVLKNA